MQLDGFVHTGKKDIQELECSIVGKTSVEAKGAYMPHLSSTHTRRLIETFGLTRDQLGDATLGMGDILLIYVTNALEAAGQCGGASSQQQLGAASHWCACNNTCIAATCTSTHGLVSDLHTAASSPCIVCLGLAGVK